MNHQYRQDVFNLMQGLCAYVSSLQAASSAIAQTTDYTAQRSTIEQVFRMTSGANFNQQSIVLRLTVVDSLYATKPATVPAKDVYYNATYVPNIYQVYYFVGFNLVHTADVPCGEKIPEYIYEPQEGEGEFLGWMGDYNETMPAHEVYFTAELGEIGTDIHQLLQDGGKLVIYNLQGRKIQVGGLHELTTGVYIINGKKVVIK